MSVRTYYASENDDDVVRPQFRSVSAGLVGDDLLFRVEVEDPTGTNVASTGVQRVLIQFFDGTTWYPVELFPANSARTEWSGGLRGPTSGVYFVQAVDGAGLTSVTANKGTNYGLVGAPADAVPFVSGGVLGDDGWYVEGPVMVELKGALVEPGSHEYSIDGAPRLPYLPGVPISVADDGETIVTFYALTDPDALPIEVTIKIDETAPTVDLDQPIAIVGPGDSVDPASIAVCADPVPGSGLRDLDPDTAADCLLSSDVLHSWWCPGQDSDRAVRR